MLIFTRDKDLMNKYWELFLQLIWFVIIKAYLVEQSVQGFFGQMPYDSTEPISFWFSFVSRSGRA